MATLATNVVTLADVAKRLDPDGSVAAVVELLSQTNEILADAHFQEGNLPTGHRVTMRTGLPTVAWRLLNQGVTPSKSTTAQVDEQCGMLEAWSEVDKDLAELNGNTNAFRLSEAAAYLESMNIEMASTLFYGNTAVDPEEFLGLAPRYSSTGAANAQNLVSGGAAGGQTDCTSIWLVVWGPNTCWMTYPKGSKAGITHENLGLQTIETAAGLGAANGRLRAYQDHWQWKTGLVLKDWRYVVRIHSIDVGLLTTETTAADLVKLMIKAMHRVPNLRMGRPVFYCNRTVAQMLDIQSIGKNANTGGTVTVINNVQFTQSGDYGGFVNTMRGIPIRTCDALLETETSLN